MSGLLRVDSVAHTIPVHHLLVLLMIQLTTATIIILCQTCHSSYNRRMYNYNNYSVLPLHNNNGLNLQYCTCYAVTLIMKNPMGQV
jgi:hypothetical protein